MKTQVSKQDLLGLLAYYLISKRNYENDYKASKMSANWHESMKDRISTIEQQITNYKSVLIMLGATDDEISQVFLGKIHGLRNFSFISDVQYYEENVYPFNH